MKLLRITLFMFLVISLTSCSFSPEKAILGKWERQDGSHETWEFFDDGTFVIDAGIDGGGDYNFVDENRIKLDFSGLGSIFGPVMIQISIDGDTLAITFESNGGEPTYYTRSK